MVEFKGEIYLLLLFFKLNYLQVIGNLELDISGNSRQSSLKSGLRRNNYATWIGGHGDRFSCQIFLIYSHFLLWGVVRMQSYRKMRKTSLNPFPYPNTCINHLNQPGTQATPYWSSCHTVCRFVLDSTRLGALWRKDSKDCMWLPLYPQPSAWTHTKLYQVNIFQTNGKSMCLDFYNWHLQFPT